MIQLYEPSNTNFRMNGEVLHPTRCEASFILNGAWILELECPYNPGIDANAVLAVPTPYGDRQLYRIKEIEKDDDYCFAVAYPIFLDSKNDCFLFDVRPTDKNGQEALNIMLNGSKYSASSNITRIATSYFYNKNFIEALNGNEDNSFICRWGGEIAYNNFEVIVNDRLGTDNGLRAEFGFNLTGINESVDMSNVVTSIIPIAFNGRMLPDKETVDSPLINNYPVARVKVFTYEDIRYIEDIDENEDVTDITVCSTLDELYAALRARASSEYEKEIDKPDITYEISIIDVSKTDLYKDFKQLTTVNLGDTVHCKNKRLNIEKSARVIKMTYDCILKEVIDLTLGDYIPSYFDNMTDNSVVVDKVVNKENNTLVADKISGIINLLNTSLKAQKNIAQKQDVRAILFEDLDPDSPTFGAMCLGTQGIQISKIRNETNTSWIWGTAIDFQSIYAQYVITGILSDKLGNNFWNLDTGELSTKHMKAVDADISGKLTSTEGEIGGFGIAKDGFIKTTNTVLKKTYTNDDVTKIRNIIMGSITPTASDYTYYDMNGDGKITASDYLFVETLLVPCGGNTLYTDVIINSFPFDANDINKPLVTVRYRGTNGNVIAETYLSARTLSTLYVQAKGVTTGYVNAETISTEVGDSLNEIGNTFLFRCFNNAEFNGGQIYAGYYGDTPNLYVEALNGGYLALCCAMTRLYLQDSVDDSFTAYFYPRDDGVILGTKAHPFYRLYATNSTTVTSDERVKKNIRSYDQRFIDMYEDLKPILYELKKFSNGSHCGLIAQQVKEAMDKHGISDEEFGVFEYDEKTDSYGIAYEELTSFNMFMIQHYASKLKKLEDKMDKIIDKLEERS